MMEEQDEFSNRKRSEKQMSSKTIEISCPLVGMHFRPPAKAILAFLPSNAAVALKLEPSNPYDANAVQVLVASTQVPEDLRSSLESQLGPMGHDLESFDAGSPWHLGYIKREYAEDLAPRLRALHEQGLAASPDVGEAEREFPAKLAFDGAGKPLVVLELEMKG